MKISVDTIILVEAQPLVSVGSYLVQEVLTPWLQLHQSISSFPSQFIYFLLHIFTHPVGKLHITICESVTVITFVSLSQDTRFALAGRGLPRTVLCAVCCTQNPKSYRADTAKHIRTVLDTDQACYNTVSSLLYDRSNVLASGKLAARKRHGSRECFAELRASTGIRARNSRSEFQRMKNIN